MKEYGICTDSSSFLLFELVHFVCGVKSLDNELDKSSGVDPHGSALIMYGQAGPGSRKAKIIPKIERKKMEKFLVLNC